MKEVLSWVWITAAGLGLLRSLLELKYALHTKEELEQSRLNGPLQIVAKNAIYLEAMRATIQLLLLIAGVAVLTDVALLESDGNLVRWCLVTAALLLLVKSELAAYTRRKVLAYKEEVK